MTTEEAIELRDDLERDLLALLQKYSGETGLTPTAAEIRTVDITTYGGRRRLEITGVRVTVEV